MSNQSYLIDTNILIGLEDNHKVDAAYAQFNKLASAHKVNVFVHEAAKEDIGRDKDSIRRQISLSKIEKYRVLNRRRGLSIDELSSAYGLLKKPNDVVDATLLHALESGAADFLVTQDKGLHERAQSRSPDLGRRVLFVADATDLLIQTYEPKEVPIRHVAEVEAHEIDHKDRFFDSLRDGYPEFDDWWREKCVKLHRPCWVVYDDERLAGLIVRKDETATDTDAITPANKILKICTFKVSPEKRGVKLGELLLKQVLWFAQTNGYDLAYLTTYEDQVSLMDLLEFYGFQKSGMNANGEFIYEREFSREAVKRQNGTTAFDLARRNFPKFLLDERTRGFGIPIKEGYHDTLYPDLWRPRQPDFFVGASRAEAINRPGNTIRKVYLCRAQSRLGPSGSVLFFYKGVSKEPPSQAITTLGILEGVNLAKSTKDLMQMTGGRSVYSEEELQAWDATEKRPVKGINYLLVAYIDPPVQLAELQSMGIIGGHPQQSIYELSHDLLTTLLRRSNLAFDL